MINSNHTIINTSTTTATTTATPSLTITSADVKRLLGMELNPGIKPLEYGWRTEKIPIVKNVEVYNNRVVKVTFADGSFTKSVCSKDDLFDLDVGITVCLIKRALGKDGHKLYNKLMRDVHKVMTKNAQETINKEKEKQEARARQRKAELKRAAKKAKARQEQIDIQKTAMVEALRVNALEANGDDLK